MSQFDLIVIGSGPGGYKAAITAAHMGARVALVERGLAGGTCLNQGCIPKKALVHLALLLEDVADLCGRGINGHISGDFAAAMAHKNAVAAGIRDNFSVWLKRLGIQVIYGEASFQTTKQVRVCPSPGLVDAPDNLLGKESAQRLDQEIVLEADRIIIATGGAPRELASFPTDGRHIFNSRDFMFRLTQLPESILCIGGGAIGVELGFFLHQFGSKVTIVEKSGRLLDDPLVPDRASALLERKFKRIGVKVRKNTTAESFRPAAGGIEVTFSDGATEVFHKALVAVGRRPVTSALGLERIGVNTDEEGYILTNDYLETNVPGIYAIGDVKGGPMTANAALHDAKIAGSNAFGGNSLRVNYRKVPLVVNSAVEIAAVGLSEELAESAGFSPDVARASFGGSGKARAQNDFEGFIEVIHDEETGQLLGGCIVGPEAGEQIHMMTAACQSERGLWFFKDMSYSHPSWCEELETAVDPYACAFSRSQYGVAPGIYANISSRRHKAD